MVLDVQTQQPHPLLPLFLFLFLVAATTGSPPRQPPLISPTPPLPLQNQSQDILALNLQVGLGSGKSRKQINRNKMSQRDGPKLDLKLNLSPPQASHPRVESPSRSLTVSPTSPPSSCVSMELNQQDESLRYSSSPEATSMMLVGCPRCLMYVMLAEEDPRCPKCKSTVLLDVIPDSTAPTAPANATARKTKKR